MTAAVHVLKGRNVHTILPHALTYMIDHGKGTESRNGPVLSLEGLTTIVYERPMERVVFHEERNANPFFHFAESLWMMAGRNDVAFPAHYVRTIANYSDDGLVFNAAYGHRWRVHFGRDQLGLVVDELKRDPSSRRAVIGIWDASHDLGLESKDLPCNLVAVPRIVDGRLDLTVYNRSNDIVWGALGANAVHFSFLQEFLARAVGADVGTYYQVSTNMHLYVKQHINLADTLGATNEHTLACPYELNGWEPFPIMSVAPEEWFQDLTMLIEHGPGTIGFKDPFFKKVAAPLLSAWDSYVQGDIAFALATVDGIRDNAWRTACRDWLIRRRSATARKERAMDDGVSYE